MHPPVYSLCNSITQFSWYDFLFDKFLLFLFGSNLAMSIVVVLRFSRVLENYMKKLKSLSDTIQVISLASS